MTGPYVLDGRTPRFAPDSSEWVAFMEEADRVVTLSEFYHGTGYAALQTFFMGWSHQPAIGGPCFFVTQFCSGPAKGEEAPHSRRRYHETWEQAEACHQALMRELLEGYRGVGPD